MPGQQELQVQQKREVEKAQEATRPMRAFLPNTDIFETEEALTPGCGPRTYRPECRERRANRRR
jgi:hypothetical protein